MNSATVPALPSSAVAFGYQPGWLVGNLPVVMQDDDLTARFVTIFEEIASTVRFSVESSADAADLSVTSGRMIEALGGWLNTPGGNGDLPVATHRAIVQADSATVRARGTAGALKALLESVTGGSVFVDDPGGTYRDGTSPRARGSLRVQLDRAGHLNDADLLRLVRDETPAHVPIAVYVAGRALDQGDPDPVKVIA